MLEFKLGDTVTFCAWQRQFRDNLKCKIVKIDYPDKYGRIFYHVKGENVISQTTGQSLKESNLFKPFGIAFELMEKHGLITNEMRSEWFTENCFVFKFENSGNEIFIRKGANLVELFNDQGMTIESINF